MFEDRLQPSIEKLHGRAKHVGKNVTYTETEDKKEDEKEASAPSPIEKLKSELKEAIKEQRFEDAAVIRDKIKEMDKGE